MLKPKEALTRIKTTSLISHHLWIQHDSFPSTKNAKTGKKHTVEQGQHTTHPPGQTYSTFTCAHYAEKRGDTTNIYKCAREGRHRLIPPGTCYLSKNQKIPVKNVGPIGGKTARKCHTNNTRNAAKKRGQEIGGLSL